MTSNKWAVSIAGLGSAGLGLIALPAHAQTFIGNPTQANGWSTTSAVQIIAHNGVAPGGRGWENVINGSGLDTATGLLHATGGPTGQMALTREDGVNGGVALGTPPGTVAGSWFVEFEFDQPYSLGNLFVWNYNENGSPLYKNFGMKSVAIQTSLVGGTNPADWSAPLNVTFGLGTGAADEPVSSIIDLAGVSAKYVTFTAAAGVTRNWSNGLYGEVGLSEVRFAQFDAATAVGWKNDASGDWNVASNWRQGFAPSGVGQTALFGDRITAPRTVYTDTALTVSTVTFDCNSSYQLSGQGSLTLAVNSGSGDISVLRGTHKINLPLTLANNTNISVATLSTLQIADPTTLAGGVTVNLNGPGTVTVLSTVNAPSAAVIKLTGAVVNFDAANNDPDITVNVDPATLNLGASQTLGNVILTAGDNILRVGRTSEGADVPAKLTASGLHVTEGGGANLLQQTFASNTVTVNGPLQIDADSKLLKQGDGVLIVKSLDIASSGQLDLAEGKLVVDYDGASPLTTDVLPKLISGRNSGAWDGNGINSSTAAADPARKAVGYAEASALHVSSFGGEVVDNTSILMRTTWKGDINLDGTVSSADFNAFVAGYGASEAAVWTQGDFNFDQKVNSLDFNDLAGNFGSMMVTAPSLGGVVPEPASLALISLAGLMLRRRH